MTRFVAVALFMTVAQQAVAEPVTAGGPTGLALAAVIAQHSTLVRPYDKSVIAEDVRPVVDAANVDLSEEKLGIVWEPNPGENPSVKLDFKIMNTLGGHPTGRSIVLTVFSGGKVKAYQDGGQETDLGTITTVGSDKIQNLLMKILQEIGAQRG